jgi:glucose-1-phosphate adenylyltransferase
MPGSRINSGAVVRNAILDKNVVVAKGAQLGVDLTRDRERYSVSDGGIVTIGKGIVVE